MSLNHILALILFILIICSFSVDRGIYRGTHISHRVSPALSIAVPGFLIYSLSDLILFSSSATNSVSSSSSSNINKEFLVDVYIGLSYIDSNGDRMPAGDHTTSVLVSLYAAFEHLKQRLGYITPVLSSQQMDSCNLNVTLRVIDTQSSPAVAVESFIYLLSKERKPDLIIGSSRSSETAPLAIVAGVQNVPVISYSSTASTLSDRSLFRLFSRTVPSDDSVAFAIANLFKAFKYKYVGVLYISDTYGLAYKDSIQYACENYGIMAFTASFQLGDKKSLENAMSDLKRRRLNVIIAVIFNEDIKNFMEIGDQYQMFGPGKLWVFTDSAFLAEMISQDAKIGKNLLNQIRVFATGELPEERGYKMFSASWSSFKEYLNDMNDYFPGGKKYKDYKMVDDAGTSKPFKLQLTDAFFARPPVGEYSSYGYDTAVTAMIAACSPSVTLPISESVSKNPLYGALLDTKFDGASGYVSFDSKGDRISQNIRLFNIRPNSKSGAGEYVETGSWNMTNWNVKYDKILFSDGTNVPPRDVDPPFEEKNLLGSSEIIFAYTLFVIAVIYCAGLIAWILVHRESKYVRFSQPGFLLLFLFGNLLVSIDIPVFTIGTPETILGDKWCMLIPWFYSVGSVLKFSSLIVKSYRIYNLFHRTQLTKSTIPLYAIIGFLLFFVSLDIVLLILWTVYSPLYWIVVVIMVDDYNFPKESFGQCSTPDFAFPLAMLIYHIILAIIASVFAYMIRQVPSQYHESRWIHLTTLFLLQLLILSIPGIAAVYDQPQVRIYFYVGLIFIEIAVSSSLIILPKIIDHKYRRKSNYNNMDIHLAGRSGGQSSHRNRKSNQSSNPESHDSKTKNNDRYVSPHEIDVNTDNLDDPASSQFVSQLNKHSILEKITEEENITSEGSIVHLNTNKTSGMAEGSRSQDLILSREKTAGNNSENSPLNDDRNSSVLLDKENTHNTDGEPSTSSKEATRTSTSNASSSQDDGKTRSQHEGSHSFNFGKIEVENSNEEIENQQGGDEERIAIV